jgi:glyoxylase-like metal-dependent hydrolase (beta-lactamase superfamily II)
VFDGVCFAADGFFGPAILQKHGIPYAQDVAGQLRSLQALAEREERFFLPGHGDLTPREQLADVLHANVTAIERSTAAVQAALPGDLATVGRRVAHTLGLVFAGIPQHAVFTSALSAHLSYLAAHGMAQIALEDGIMIWKLAQT